MAYRFRRKESVPEGIRRIVVEQSSKAADELSGGNPDIHDGVHNARKSFKKIRSLLRLAQSDLDKKVYTQEKKRIRKIKNRLASARDAEAMIETFEALSARFPAVRECPSLGNLRDELGARRQKISEEEVDLQQVARSTADELLVMQQLAESWDLSADGFGALGPGMLRSYRKGRKAMKTAHRKETDEHFHEWRKQVKDHWYHSRLLGKIWPDVMSARIDELKRLSDLLGDDHDLSVLCDLLENEGDNMEADGVTLICLSRRRQQELRAEARELGERIYAKTPQCFADELEGYWDTWKGSA